MHNSIRTVENDKSKSFGIILAVYFALKPLYLLPSGLPQIGDVLLVISALSIFFFKERLRIIVPNRHSMWIYIFLATLCYQTIVEIMWWVETDDEQMLLKLSYYVFNFMASFLCIYIGTRIGAENLKLAICKGCFYSAIVTSIGSVLNFSSGVRSTGLFNNPNQLGYHALLIATVVAFFPDQLPKWQSAFIILVSVFGTVISASKAALAGLAGLLVCYSVFGNNKKTVKTMLLQTTFLFIGLAIIYLFLYSDMELITENQTLYFARSRILRMFEENDSSLGEGRGYLRAQELGIHFLWGMGEGDYYRFTFLPGREIHSTFVNLLVSYGIIGFCLYFWLIVKSMLGGGKSLRNLSCFFGLFLYFFTHNGIRNTLFWILMVTVMQVSAEEKSEVIS